MKKILSLLLMLFTFQQSSFPQDQHLVDSLQNLLKTSKQDTARANLLYQLSMAYWGNYLDKAMDYARQTLAISEKINYKKGMGNGYNSMGAIYYYKGNYPKALECFQMALKLFEAIGYKKGLGESFNYFGLIYAQLGNNTEALKNHLAALKIREEIGSIKSIAGSYNNIGEDYRKLGNTQEALKNFFAALSINKETGNKNWESINRYNIGLIYYEQGNYSEALNNFVAALKISEEIGDKDGIAGSCTSIGATYTKQHKYIDASYYLNKGLSVAKEIGSLEAIKESYSGFAMLDIARGNYRQALEYYKRFIATRDSMFNQETNKKIVQLQMQYDFDKKESLTKAENEKELQKQKLVRNGFICGFAVVLLFAVVFFRQRNKISKAKKISEAEKERCEELLLNILPAEVADEIKTSGTAKAKAFTMVTVMFTDFKDFTIVSEKISAELLVDEIHTCFSAFDTILHKYNIEKIKTIGDAYLCASGLPVSTHTHAQDMLFAAFEIRSFMLHRKKEKEAKGEIPFELRIGIHTGPVVAGVVGVKKYAYDIWGDTVNIAARMEQNSEAGKINISGSTYELVKAKFKCEHRGKIQAKNKGEIDMYFVETNS